ncbi:ureide permease 1-like [Humulus lupulus]|uniref:ureide permease 1-like n=1 Tax=Humulus lupulus TaxID=3486 RepID=UPI002B40E64F|nr:ureide permease 1-like [Humulus lupulus]XP_062112037.1 ureide permease 1-like [Humulus lupulus]XP_062112038.1 ureide permease 1-like [Humulus lupulus]
MERGVVLSLGNLSTQYAWAFVGLSVTEVITASITVVIGITLNYFLDNRINRAEILFPSIGCFLVAVFLASVVHSSNAVDNKGKLEGFSSKEGGWALMAGLLCRFGNGLQFMGGQAAGYAAADAVQALPLVSTFWGILLFGEYRKSSRRTYILLIQQVNCKRKSYLEGFGVLTFGRS